MERGVNPLFWHSIIKLEITLRIQLQNDLFGHTTISKKNIPQANEKYYRYCFEHSFYICENCGLSLYLKRNIEGIYSSVFVSHILSRSSSPEMAHDPRNHNILCFNCHQKWESPKNKEMLIYEENKIVINELINDYSYIRNIY